MKKKTLLIVSTSFALGVGVIGSGVGVLLHQKASTPGVMEDATLPSDEIGARVRLGAEGDATTDPTVVAPTFVNTLGYRLIDEESGAKSIRVYAVLDGYKGLNSASVTRKVEDSTGASVMKEKTIEFGYVYSSIKDAESVTWDDALPVETDTTKNYYVVFTLKNIPEAHWLDKLSVTFAVDNGAIVKSAEALANVKGLMEKEVGVGVTLTQAESGVIFAMREHKSITEAVVPENYYTYEGHVATFVGKVTRLGDPTVLNTGAFEGCTSLTSVTLPDTIAEMGGWTFGNASKLTTIRLPRDLRTVRSNCWSSNSFKTIYLDAVNFVNDEDATLTAQLDEIVISENVQSLPNKFLYSTSSVKKVVFKGTTEQWEALKTEANKDNGLFIDNVVTSDNSYIVTYHLPEGVTLNGQSGVVKAEFIKGKTVDYGMAVKVGFRFSGWYIDEALSTPLDTATPTTANLDLYPKFTEFGPGVSETKPIVLGEENTTFTESLVPGYEEVYLKYTAPADAVAGWRYVRINKDTSVTNTDLSIDVSSLGNQKLFFYKDSVSTENAIAESSTSYLTDTAKVQRISGDDGYKRVWVEPGQTYVIVADAYYSTFYPERHWYGDLVIEWSKAENDTIATAASIAFQEEKVVKPAFRGAPATLYKYTPTADQSVAMYLTSYNQLGGVLHCYDATSETPTEVDSVSYKYESGAAVAENKRSIKLTAGHTYIFYVDAYDGATDEKYLSFRIDNPPAGGELSNPIAYTFGSEVTVEQVADIDVFYSFTLEAEQTVNISISGGSSYTAKYLKLLGTDGAEVADAGDEVPEREGSGWYAEEYYGRIALSLTKKLPAGTYVIKTGYVSGSSFSNFKLTSKVMQPGETIYNPLTAEVSSEGVTTLNATTAGTFYQISATQAGFMQFNVAATGSGKLYLVDSTGKTISTATNGQSFYKSVTVGDTLILKAADAADTLTVTITYPSEIHDGKSRETAYNLVLPTSGETVDITYASGSTRVSGAYFKFSVGATGTYRIYTRNEKVDTNVVGVYEEGSETKIAGSYTDDDHQKHAPYTSSTFGRDTYSEVPLEAGKTYYLKLDLYPNTTNETILLGFGLLGEGDTSETAIAKTWTDNVMTLAGNLGPKFYSFTETETNSYDLTTTCSVDGVTPTVAIYENGKELTAEGAKKNRYAFEAGKTYVVRILTTQIADVTITRAVHVGAFTGSAALGQYIGAQNGGSYYKVTVTADGVAYERGDAEEPTAGPTIVNGVITFTAASRDYYTNGTDMVAKTGYGFMFLSKRQTTYSGAAVNGQLGKTADASMTSGVILQSIVIDGGSRIYSVIKDGTIYFDAAVEFAADNVGDIHSSTKPFTVKDASGTVIGTFNASNGTLTEVTSPAA